MAMAANCNESVSSQPKRRPPRCMEFAPAVMKLLKRPWISWSHSSASHCSENLNKSSGSPQVQLRFRRLSSSVREAKMVAANEQSLSFEVGTAHEPTVERSYAERDQLILNHLPQVKLIAKGIRERLPVS